MQKTVVKPGPVHEPRAEAAGVGIEVKNVSKYFRRTRSVGSAYWLSVEVITVSGTIT